MATKRPRKRAPGGGRKPQGGLSGKVEAFTTRITPETRIALERAAARNGRSISSEAEQRLRISFQKPLDAITQHNAALARAVGLLAERIERDSKESWRHDPFTGLALRYAVEMVLLHFVPTSEGPAATPPAINEAAAKMPPDLADHYRKPAGLGHMRAFSLLADIEQAPLPVEPQTQDEWNQMLDEWGLVFSSKAPLDVLGWLRLELGSKSREDKS